MIHCEFHVTRDARQKYSIVDPLFASSDDLPRRNLQVSRDLARKMNEARDLARHPGTAVSAGDLNAMGLINEILHHVVDAYGAEYGSTAISGALDGLTEVFGTERVESALTEYLRHYPLTDVFNGAADETSLLGSQIEGWPGRTRLLEAVVL
ncbi:MAG: hypothetical protein E4H09_03200, partial [Spirochaetales bacterium]